MQIIYPGIKKEVNDAGFILANRLGGYLFLSNSPASRYQGLFFMDNFKMYKTIENLELESPVEEIKFSFNSIQRKRKDVVETFFMPALLNSVVYELNKKAKVDLILDCKESYDNREFGRFYEISEEKGKIVIKYTKQEWQEEEDEYVLYLVIKQDKLDYEKKDAWFERHYPLDEKRKSPPFKRYVYKALALNSQKAVFSVSADKEAALKEADYVFRNIGLLKKKNLIKLKGKSKDNEINLAYNCALNSLKSLTYSDSTKGILAGLPWFFQFWTRDELICAKALCSAGEKGFAKNLIMTQLRGITVDGKMFDKYPASGLKNADSIGWLFKRASEMELNKKEKELAKKELEFCLNATAKTRMENGLVKNNALETWMDTAFQGDDRAGFRIEIQAMQLFMYKMMYELSKDEKYKKRELRLKKKVRAEFWNGKFLADGIGDDTIRPNIFIAAYFYPELLTEGEWRRCFERIIPKLWLEWGGFSTIDLESPLFTEEHSGEDNKSYHRGDSWFWLNNLAAIVLNKIDKKEFKRYIEKILKASTEEILWKGAIGTAAELSSAKELRSEGCLMQAWSNAMFIEMVDELF